VKSALLTFSGAAGAADSAVGAGASSTGAVVASSTGAVVGVAAGVQEARTNDKINKSDANRVNFLISFLLFAF
jgi:hypothetical protein